MIVSSPAIRIQPNMRHIRLFVVFSQIKVFPSEGAGAIRQPAMLSGKAKRGKSPRACDERP